jgi:predicted esterase
LLSTLTAAAAAASGKSVKRNEKLGSQQQRQPSLSCSTRERRMTFSSAVIFLHGLGDSGAGWHSLEQQMRPHLPYTKFIFPNSPEAPVTVNNGMEMPSWFDVINIPVNESEPDDPAQLESSIKFVQSLIDTVCSEHSITADKVVLGGFSQGGAMALISGVTYSEPLAGIVSLSGWSLQKTKQMELWQRSLSLSLFHSPLV